MHGSAHTFLGSVMFAALAFGCANGDEESAGSFSATNLTYTMPATMTATATVPMTTLTSGEMTGSEATSEDPDPDTTDPVVTTGTPDPSTTAPDPSTTAPDPSTTNMTLTTDGTTTDDPPPPPPKANQPTSGLYENCLEGTECDAPTACLQVTDSMTMMIYDGFCTLSCANLASCGMAPNAPAVQKCMPFDVGLNICVLECVTTNDCPTGMICTAVSNPNMTEANICI